MSKTIAVISAGLSDPSSTRLLADRMVDAATRLFDDRTADATFTVIELREYAVDIANMMVTGFAAPRLREALDLVENADGVIAVTPIFTASYSGLFKSFIDLLDRDSLTGVPVLIGATAGTARHSLALEHALRPLFAYLRAIVMPTAVFAASEDWASDGDITARAERGAVEFVDAVTRFERHLEPEFMPFEQQLRTLGAS